MLTYPRRLKRTLTYISWMYSEPKSFACFIQFWSNIWEVQYLYERNVFLTNCAIFGIHTWDCVIRKCLWVCGCADQSWPPPTSSPALSACPLSKINKNILFTFKKENKRLNTVEWEKSLLKKALLASAASAEDKQTRPSWIWDIVWARGKVAQVKLRVGLSEQLLYSCVGKAISSWGEGRLWW